MAVHGSGLYGGQGSGGAPIGCRTGEVLELMKDRASRLYGIELNPRYARTAKQKAQGQPVCPQ